MWKNIPLLYCQVRRSNDQSKAGSQLDDFYRDRNIFDKSAEDKFWKSDIITDSEQIL